MNRFAVLAGKKTQNALYTSSDCHRMAILYPDATIISEYRMQAGLSIRHFGIGAEHPFSYVSHGRHHWWLLHLFPPDWFPPRGGVSYARPNPFLPTRNIIFSRKGVLCSWCGQGLVQHHFRWWLRAAKTVFP